MVQPHIKYGKQLFKFASVQKMDVNAVENMKNGRDIIKELTLISLCITFIPL